MNKETKKLEGKIPLEEVLSRFNAKNAEFKKELDKEEKYEDNIETVDSIQNDIKAIKESTKRNKYQFIEEMRTGLGDKIKENPTQITVIKKKWHEKLGNVIKNIFTKF